MKTLKSGLSSSMGCNMKRLSSGLLLTVALSLGPEASAQVDFEYGPITNNAVLVPTTVQEYLVEARNPEPGKGIIYGNTNSWILSGDTATLVASPNVNDHYRFINWTDGLGGTELSTDTNFQFSVTVPATNIYANFDIERFNVQIENASVYGASPTNFANVPYGGSVTSEFENVYFTNAPGSRLKVMGLQVNP